MNPILDKYLRSRGALDRVPSPRELDIAREQPGEASLDAVAYLKRHPEYAEYLNLPVEGKLPRPPRDPNNDAE
jgi:hypothetical protein